MFEIKEYETEGTRILRIGKWDSRCELVAIGEIDKMLVLRKPCWWNAKRVERELGSDSGRWETSWKTRNDTYKL